MKPPNKSWSIKPVIAQLKTRVPAQSIKRSATVAPRAYSPQQPASAPASRIGFPKVVQAKVPRIGSRVIQLALTPAQTAQRRATIAANQRIVNDNRATIRRFTDGNYVGLVLQDNLSYGDLGILINALQASIAPREAVIRAHSDLGEEEKKAGHQQRVAEEQHLLGRARAERQRNAPAQASAEFRPIARAAAPRFESKNPFGALGQ